MPVILRENVWVAKHMGSADFGVMGMLQLMDQHTFLVSHCVVVVPLLRASV